MRILGDKKFNGGYGAIICQECQATVIEGDPEEEIKRLKAEIEEFGRKAFYRGREVKSFNDRGDPIFKRPTYNGYLREIEANASSSSS